MVVQAAVGDLRGLEEAPHICIRPAQDRVHPHEGRPARAAGAELVLPARIRIPSAAQHSSVSGTCHAVAVMCTHEECGLPGQFPAHAACSGPALQCTGTLHHCVLRDAYGKGRWDVVLRHMQSCCRLTKRTACSSTCWCWCGCKLSHAGHHGRLPAVRLKFTLPPCPQTKRSRTLLGLFPIRP